MTFSEFPTEADLEDFTEAAVDEDNDDDEDEDEGEEVVEDRDYYYDTFKGDDYTEENPTEPSSDGAISEKEITHDVKGNPMSSGGSKTHMVTVYLELWSACITGKSQKERGCLCALKGKSALPHAGDASLAVGGWDTSGSASCHVQGEVQN